MSDGILVDQSLRTSDPDIFAAGDVANAYNPLFGRRIRVEHWANALNGGPAAARAMLGQDVVYDRMPVLLQRPVRPRDGDVGRRGPRRIRRGRVPRGRRRSREFVVFWLSGGRVVAGMNVNVWDVTGDVQALIRSGARVDRARLADPDVSLSSPHISRALPPAEPCPGPRRALSRGLPGPGADLGRALVRVAVRPEPRPGSNRVPARNRGLV